METSDDISRTRNAGWRGEAELVGCCGGLGGEDELAEVHVAFLDHVKGDEVEALGEGDFGDVLVQGPVVPLAPGGGVLGIAGGGDVDGFAEGFAVDVEGDLGAWLQVLRRSTV